MALTVTNASASKSQSLTLSDGADKRPRRSREERNKRAGNRRPKSSINTLVFNPFFILLFGLLAISCMISFFLVLSHPEGAWGKSEEQQTQIHQDNVVEQKQRKAEQKHEQKHEVPHPKSKTEPKAAAVAEKDGAAKDDDDNEEKPKERFAGFQPGLKPHYKNVKPYDTTLETPHLIPYVDPLQPFTKIENSEQLIDDVLHNNKPTMAGVIAFFDDYIQKLHVQNKAINAREQRAITGEKIDTMGIVKAYYNLTEKFIDPLEDAYRGRNIFPVREDGSVYISLAAFREHLLAQTMMSAFDNAKDPDRLFVGAVVQNCFGLDGVVCKTGLQVVGKYKNGRDRTSVSPAPPDKNGLVEFCTHENYKKYCDAGQVRALYIHDTDALGPQTARFYASKLYGGENYFLQMDSHLLFAPDWEQYFIDEMTASRNYPKSILSSYPPGFSDFNGTFVGGTRGERLCRSHFSPSSVENNILRIEQFGLTPKNMPRPTQIPFIAAGFFFAHSAFLRDVPFDPYAPWCFMGEEIALSIRAWTSGWNIYAPRLNVIAHQYRMGKLGLPKFWESVGRDTDRGSLNTRLQNHVLRRIKHMLSYPTDSVEEITKDHDEICLHNFDHYSMGHERELEDYLQWTTINPTKQEVGQMQWCIKAELE